jgi:outer membrane receptor protein involved in Fe transport
LASGKKYGTFPGASIGWRLVQEKFWQANPFLRKNVSEFKLKASYATVGNRLGGFPYLSTFGSRPYGNISGIAVAAIGNPDLQWEQSKKYDIGFELGLLNNKINISFDYFKNDLDNLVLAVPTPFSTGVPLNQINQNIGRVQNKGVELTFNATIVRKKDFEWNFNFNYTHIKNKIISLYSIAGVPVTELFPSNYNINRIGESINSIFGLNLQALTQVMVTLFITMQAVNWQRNIKTGYHFANSMSDPTLGAATSLTTAIRKYLEVPNQQILVHSQILFLTKVLNWISCSVTKQVIRS